MHPAGGTRCQSSQRALSGCSEFQVPSSARRRRGRCTSDLDSVLITPGGRGTLTRALTPSIRGRREFSRQRADHWQTMPATPSTSRSRVLRVVKRVIVSVIGGTVLLIGIALVVLPGPAFIVIPIGLAILATEYAWAKHLLRRAREYAAGFHSRATVAKTSPDVTSPPITPAQSSQAKAFETSNESGAPPK